MHLRLSQLGHEGFLVSTLPDNSVGDAAISSFATLRNSGTFVSRGGKYLVCTFWKMDLEHAQAVLHIPIDWKVVSIRHREEITNLKKSQKK